MRGRGVKLRAFRHDVKEVGLAVEEREEGVEERRDAAALASHVQEDLVVFGVVLHRCLRWKELLAVDAQTSCVWRAYGCRLSGPRPTSATPWHHPHTTEARESGPCGTTAHTEQHKLQIN